MTFGEDTELKPGVEKANLGEKLGSFRECWSPRIIGEVNDFHVKLVKLEGEFVWHHHEVEDELFLVVKGRMRMCLGEGEVEVNEGELIVVPHGVEHMPAADEETHVLVFEPKSTVNTGNVRSERTVAEPERI